MQPVIYVCLTMLYAQSLCLTLCLLKECVCVCVCVCVHVRAHVCMCTYCCRTLAMIAHLQFECMWSWLFVSHLLLQFSSTLPMLLTCPCACPKQLRGRFSQQSRPRPHQVGRECVQVCRRVWTCVCMYVHTCMGGCVLACVCIVCHVILCCISVCCVLLTVTV